MVSFFPFWLTFKVALLTSVILLIIAIILAYFMAYYANKYVYSFLLPLINLPLILPPTVLGFYLLLIYSPNNIIGKTFFNIFGYTLSFSVTGIVIASIIYSLPFMVQPILNSFKNIPLIILDNCKVIGKGHLIILFKVIIPLSYSGILTGFILTFMHTVGEFGVVFMIGGNIPYKTQMVSMKIYEDVETLNYFSAHIYSSILVIFSVVMLFLVYLISNIKNKKYHV